MASVKELTQIQIKTLKNMKEVDGKAVTRVLIGMATCGIAAGAAPVLKALEKTLSENGAQCVELSHTGCIGICQYEPIVEVLSPGQEKVTYVNMTAEKAEKVALEHIIGGKPVLEYTEAKVAKLFEKQGRAVLRNCGVIDPENIDEYIARDGYKALAQCLTEKKPGDVIDIIKASGLRGRGGGGFPTGLKWSFTAANAADQKYVVCNADEGDPGAFMDRSVLEGDPHAVVEAMAICGYATGATEGYIYVRAEYPIAVRRLEIAIKRAKEYGLLGKNIFGSGFDFELFIRLGAGAFVCGEETALMTSIEGNRGEPRVRPPYPAVKGLFGKPTTENNVETFANVPQIVLRGADWFSSMGTEKSKGTKVFALGGKISNTGLVEIPMGTTLREIVEDIGGGIPGGRQFKAAQTGGPSGGCIPAQLMDTEIDYDNLTAIGCMMGSGGLIVMDEDNCMVDVAKFFLTFTVDESCGKCTPCRIGTRRLLEILEKIIEGKGEPSDLDRLEELCLHIKQNSLCGLGQTAPNPVLATLKFFRHEYEEHVNEKKCRAGVCKSLLSFVINPEKCVGCTACARVCPTGAISGEVKKLHVIDQAKCIKCGACESKCRFSAISKK
jgi:NADP-reducing hydrogenase subunit HndC